MVDIKDTDGKYKAEEGGKIYSFHRGKLRQLVGSANSWGYYTLVVFLKDGTKRGTAIHRLVAETFIPNPNALPQVNHINGDKSDNRVDNLEWVSGKDNVRHAIDTGLWKPHNRDARKVLQYKNGQLIKMHDSITGLKKKGYEPCNIRNAIKGNIKHAYGYQWAFAQ